MKSLNFVFSLLLSLALLTSNVSSAEKVWSGAGNTNLRNNTNWTDSIAPDFVDKAANPTTDSFVFNNALNTDLNLNAHAAPDASLADYTVQSILFGTDAGAFVFKSGASKNFVFGDSSTASPTGSNTGNLTNHAIEMQTFDVNVAFRFGIIDAAGAGGFRFGTHTTARTFNIGYNLTAAANNVTIAGDGDVAIYSVLTGAGTDSTDGGHLIKKGAGVLSLNAENTNWNGRIVIEEGTVQIAKNTALGSNIGRTTIGGGVNKGKLEISGGISVGESLHLTAREDAGTFAHISNASGNNSLTSTVLLGAGPGNEIGLHSESGTFLIGGDIIYDSTLTSTSATVLKLSGDGDGVINGNIGAGALNVGIVKEGAGIWTLNAANAYTGSTSILEGRLNITAAQSGGGAISTSDDTTLAVKLTGSGQTLNTSALSLGGGGVSALIFDLGSYANASTPVIDAGSLTLNGTVTVSIAAQGLTEGTTYTLINYAGALGGSGTFSPTLILPARVLGSINTLNNKVSLVVDSFDVPVWTGKVDDDDNGAWDINDLSDPDNGVGTSNWKVKSGASTRYLQIGTTIDSVLFDDTAEGTTNVNLTTALTPVTATVDNSILEYVFSGVGKLSGAANLVKSGSGVLILANTGGNDYTGTTTINAGILQIGDGVTIGGGQLGSGAIHNQGSLIFNRPDDFSVTAAISGNGSITKRGTAIVTLSGNSDFSGEVTIEEGTVKLGNSNGLGNGAGDTIVESGATLDLNGQTLAVESIKIVGEGIGGAGALVNNEANAVVGGVKKLTLEGDTTLGGSAAWEVQGNNDGFTGAGFNLTKKGTGLIRIANAGETGLANITVTQGELAFEGGSTLGDNAGSILVQSGAIITVGSNDNALIPLIHTKAITLNGGILRASIGTKNEISSDVTLTANSIIRTANTTVLKLTGAILGSAYNLTKNTGNGTLILTSDGNDYKNTTISTGVLQIGNDGTTGKLGTGNVTNNATLNFRRSDALTVANIISGSGEVNIGSGGGASPNLASIITLSGINTFTGNISINAGVLKATNSKSLGGGTKIVSITNASRPSLLLDGSLENIALDAGISFVISSDGTVNSAAGISSTAGDNIINGGIAISNGGGGNGKIAVQAGSLVLNGGITADVSSTSARIIVLGGSGIGTANGVIANGAGTQTLGVTKDGSGTWTITGTNTYTGVTAIQDGTLKVTKLEALGAATSAITFGTATTTGTFEYAGGSDANLTRALTIGTVGGGIIKNSTSHLLTLSGNITKNQRSLTFTGGRFSVTGEIIGNANLGELKIDNAVATFSNSANSYKGATYIYGGGTLINGSSEVLQNETTLVLGEAVNNSNGTYDLNGHDETIAGLYSAGSGSKSVTNNAASGTVNFTLNGTGTFDGVIKDGASVKVALTKSVGGVQTLSGVNTYTGATNVTGGILALTSTGSLASKVTVNTGGGLDNSGLISAGVIVQDGGLLYTGGLGTTGTSTIHDSLNLANNSSLFFDIGGYHQGAVTDGFDFIHLTGDLSVSDGVNVSVALVNAFEVKEGDTFQLIDWTTFTPTATLANFSLTDLSAQNLKWDTDSFLTLGRISVIASIAPEPGRVSLLLLASTLLFVKRRRRSANVVA